jgi:hypothetical protein
MTAADAFRTKAARRQRRYRLRRARGDQFFRGDLPYDTLVAMIDRGLVEPDNAADPISIGRALAALAHAWACGLSRR